MAYKVLTLTDAANQPIAFATVSQDVTERNGWQMTYEDSRQIFQTRTAARMSFSPRLLTSSEIHLRR